MKRRFSKFISVIISFIIAFSSFTVLSPFCANAQAPTVFVAGTDVSQGGYWRIDGTDSSYRSVLVEADQTNYNVFFDTSLNLLIIENARLFGTGESAVHFKNMDLQIKYIGDCYIGEHCVYTADGELTQRGKLNTAVHGENGTLTISSDKKSALIVCSGEDNAVISADNGLIIDKRANVSVTRNKSAGTQNECAIKVNTENAFAKVTVYDSASLTVDCPAGELNQSSAANCDVQINYAAKFHANEKVNGDVVVNGGNLLLTDGLNGGLELLVGEAEVHGEISGNVNMQSGMLMLDGDSSVKGTLTVPQDINKLFGATRNAVGQIIPIVKYTYDEGIKVNLIYEPAFIDIFTGPDKIYRLEPVKSIYVIEGFDLALYIRPDNTSCATAGYTVTSGGQKLEYTQVNSDSSYRCYTLKNITEETDISISIHQIKTKTIRVQDAKVDAVTGEMLSGTLPQGVSYNPENTTLTLNNANLSQGDSYTVIDCDGEMTIELIGNNTISFEGIYGKYTAAISSWILNITGDGTLNINGKSGGHCRGIWVGERGLTIKEATVNITIEKGTKEELTSGIMVYNRAGMVIDSGATVNIDICDGVENHGIYYSGNCYINDSFVNISVGKSDEAQTHTGAIVYGIIPDDDKDLRINGKQCFPEGNTVKITPDDLEFSPSEIILGGNILFKSHKENRQNAIYDTYEYCTVENGILVPCDPTDEWTVHYDFRTNTLYLHNFNYVFDKGSGIVADGNLNIELVDLNRLETTAEQAYGIEAKGKLNFTGDGSLSIISSGASGKAVIIYGSSTSDIGFAGKISYPAGSTYAGSKKLNGMQGYNPEYLPDYCKLYITGSDSSYTNQYKSVIVTFKYGYNSLTETIETYSTGKLKKALPEPTRSGYIFEGWYYTDDTGREIQITEATRFSANTTVKAKWTKIKLDYYVTFDPDGGTVSTPEMQANTYGYLYSLPVPTRDNYTFLGWFSEPSGEGEEITTETKFYENTTVYAHWLCGIYVNFDACGGTVEYTEILTDEYGILQSLPVPVRDSYTFLGWFTLPEGGVQVSGNAAFTEEATLYAQWKKGVTVTFDPNGGTVDKIYDTTNEYDYLYSLPMPNREGYTFDGWFTEIDGGEIVTSETKFKTSVTVYAHWTKLPDEPVTDEPATDDPSTGEEPTDPVEPPDDTPADSWFVRFFKAIKNFFTTIILWFESVFGFII